MHELCVLLLLGTAQVTALSLCDTDDGYVESENKSDNWFHCRDISATSTVSWLIADVYGNDINLGTCPPPTSSPQSSCNASSLAPLLTSYRNSSDVSFLILDANVTGKPNSWAGLPLTCRTESNYVRCFIDFIYRPTDASCKVQFTNTAWSVSGHCNISQIFSQRLRYRCRIYERKEGVESKTLLANTSMPTTSIGYNASSATCTFQSYLPPEGRYHYTVIVIPGEVEFPFVFTGSNEIRKPSISPYQDCPKQVQEGQDITCTCSISDYGAPSGVLQWNNTGSTQLSLTNVTRDNTGTFYVCTLTWNNTRVWTVNYTLIVTYPPTILSFKANYSNNMTIVVTESSYVTLSCEASGRPSPGMSLINTRNEILSRVPAGDTTAADPRVTLTYNVSTAQCEDSGSYRCEAENGEGRDNKSLMLLVLCSPRSLKSDNPFPSITFRDKVVRLQFNLTAYPVPEVVDVTYLGHSSLGSILNETLISANCAHAQGHLSSVTCTVTVNNVTAANMGNYRTTVQNSLGQLKLLFEVKMDGDKSQDEPLKTADYSRTFGSGIGVGVGVTVGVFAILHIAGVVWLWRRNWVLPCRAVKENPQVRSLHSAAGKDISDCSHELSGNEYDALHLNEVGVKSLYSSLGAENQSKNVAKRKPQIISPMAQSLKYKTMN